MYLIGFEIKWCLNRIYPSHIDILQSEESKPKNNFVGTAAERWNEGVEKVVEFTGRK
jgi:hypothetical protein